MMASTGSTIDRNTTNSSRKLIPKTNGNTIHAEFFETLKNFMLKAVLPETYILAPIPSKASST